MKKKSSDLETHFAAKTSIFQHKASKVTEKVEKKLGGSSFSKWIIRFLLFGIACASGVGLWLKMQTWEKKHNL